MSSTPVMEKYSEPGVPTGVLGMIFFLFTEVMLFSGLISAYLVKRNTAASIWPPPGQPRLPAEQTLVNTAFLIASGLSLWHLQRLIRKNAPVRVAKVWISVTIMFGIVFVALQGIEWFHLIRFGLTVTSSLFGGFFYMIIGFHGIHVLIGLAVLIYEQFRIIHREQDMQMFDMSSGALFWYFVVCIWPLLYYLVYIY